MDSALVIVDHLNHLAIGVLIFLLGYIVGNLRGSRIRVRRSD